MAACAAAAARRAALAVRGRCRPSLACASSLTPAAAPRRRALCAAAESAVEPLVAGAADAGGPPARPASPPALEIRGEVELYRSHADLAGAARKARMNNILGSAFGFLGFAGVAAGAPSAPLAIHAIIGLGATMNLYKHLGMSRNEFGAIGMRYLETLTVMPHAHGAQASSGAAGGPAHEPVASESTAAEMLKATPHVHLRLRTVNVDLHLTLVEPAAAWEGSKYSGLVNDDRTSFHDVLCALFIEEVTAIGKKGAPTSPDQNLLAALLQTNKVLADHHVSLRTDAEIPGLFALPADAAAEYQKFFDDVPDAEKKRKKLRNETGSGMHGSVGIPRSAIAEIQQVGKASIISGFVFLTAGSIFLGRWFNGQGNSMPGQEAKEFTPDDFFDLWRARFAGAASGGERM